MDQRIGKLPVDLVYFELWRLKMKDLNNYYHDHFSYGDDPYGEYLVHSEDGNGLVFETEEEMGRWMIYNFRVPGELDDEISNWSNPSERIFSLRYNY